MLLPKGRNYTDKGLLQRRRGMADSLPQPSVRKRRWKRPLRTKRQKMQWWLLLLVLMMVMFLVMMVRWVGQWILGATWPVSTIQGNLATGPLGAYPVPINQQSLRFRGARSLEALAAKHPVSSLPNATEWPLVHIVNTRFMQDQGRLTILGTARLHLFETFCLPSMLGQTTDEFLWIVKTDPQLDSKLLKSLIRAVQDRPNIYVVGSSTNFLVSPNQTGCWRDGAEPKDLLKSPIYTGDLTRLEQAMLLRTSRPVLETRLDADDGLHKAYLQYLQTKALRRFLGIGGPTTRWLYWCTRRHVEWHASPKPPSNTTKAMTGPEDRRFQEEPPKHLTDDEEGASNDKNDDRDSDEEEEEEDDPRKGQLQPIQHSRLCVTPGITVGYNLGVEASEVPIESHDLLYKHLLGSTACFGTGGHPPLEAASSSSQEASPACLDLVDSFWVSAVRSRTLTSAGMMKVGLTDDERNRVNPTIRRRLWAELANHFSISPRTVEKTQAYLWSHQEAIARENLLGQCTRFHSCKPEAKEELRKYLEAVSPHEAAGPFRPSTTR